MSDGNELPSNVEGLKLVENPQTELGGCFELQLPVMLNSLFDAFLQENSEAAEGVYRGKTRWGGCLGTPLYLTCSAEEVEDFAQRVNLFFANQGETFQFPGMHVLSSGYTCFTSFPEHDDCALAL